MIENCRLCESPELRKILELGDFSLSGVFPKMPKDSVLRGPLSLLICEGCSLVQLSVSFPSHEMYGENYGYRSGLNASMVKHLAGVVDYANSLTIVKSNDTVLDIGSNDGTLLRHWGSKPGQKIGIDPTAKKFLEYYDEASTPVPDFFTSDSYFSAAQEKARVVTSIAMLYDLEDPVSFCSQIEKVLDDEGVWVSEQSYMPWMVLTGAYDTICHEHIEYYSLTSINQMLAKSGLRCIDAEINDANGGSIRFAAVKVGSSKSASGTVDALLAWEQSLGILSPSFFEAFSSYVLDHGPRLNQILSGFVSEGFKVGALGASTKGSIVLQHASLDSSIVSFVGDVNPFKFGRYMVNSDIQIVQEDEALIRSADVLLVLPWHFKESFRRILKDFLADGGVIVWPLPDLVIETQNSREVIMTPSMDKTPLGFGPLRATQIS